MTRHFAEMNTARVAHIPAAFPLSSQNALLMVSHASQLHVDLLVVCGVNPGDGAARAFDVIIDKGSDEIRMQWSPLRLTEGYSAWRCQYAPAVAGRGGSRP